MILKRLYDERLAQASYLVGCSTSGEALVVDPNRDLAQFVDAAEAEGLRITHVAETHIHADYLSGSRELAQRTGAALYLSDEGDAEWKYAFAEAAGAHLVRDGDVFRVGCVKVEVLHTPGHTPEHLSFLVTDTEGADRPIGIFTGDFVFVSDVGRPDLLERAAHYAGTMEAGARTLFRSLQRFKELPDYLQVWPGHGAGSACGKSLGAVPQTTVGYERLFNWALSYTDEDAFVEAVLAGQPEPPKYFAAMKRLNKEGPPNRAGVRPPPHLPAERLGALLDAGAPIVDIRSADRFAAGHVAGALNLPRTRSFTTWAGSLLPYDREVYLIADDEDGAEVAATQRDLAMIGLDRVGGYFSAAAVLQWAAERDRLRTVRRIEAADLAARLRRGEVEVLDVRGRAEWDAGHLPGARHLPVGDLTEHLDEIPRARPVVVHCQTGGRSAIAASLLQARGFDNVLDFRGGFAAWSAEGHPVDRPPAGTDAESPVSA